MITIGLIGCGKMGSAIVRNLAQSNLVNEFKIYDSNRSQSDLLSKQLLNVSVSKDPSEVLQSASATFLAVKPQDVIEATSIIRNQEGLIISILAGVSLSKLRNLLVKARLVRVMPNAPCAIGAMAAGFTLSETVRPDDCKLIQNLLNALGLAFEMPENKLDAVTGLSGSGPAFLARIFEWLSEAGIKEGLDPPVALALTLQTAIGTVLLMQKQSLTTDQLVNMISSPAGTTLAGLKELESGAVRNGLLRTVQAASTRSKELGKTKNQSR